MDEVVGCLHCGHESDLAEYQAEGGHCPVCGRYNEEQDMGRHYSSRMAGTSKYAPGGKLDRARQAEEQAARNKTIDNAYGDWESRTHPSYRDNFDNAFDFFHDDSVGTDYYNDLFGDQDMRDATYDRIRSRFARTAGAHDVDPDNPGRNTINDEPYNSLRPFPDFADLALDGDYEGRHRSPLGPGYDRPGFGPDDVAAYEDHLRHHDYHTGNLRIAAIEFLAGQNTDDRQELLFRAHRHASEKTAQLPVPVAQRTVQAFVAAVNREFQPPRREPVQRTAATLPDFDDQLLFDS